MSIRTSARVSSLLLVLACAACAVDKESTVFAIQHLNPQGMHRNPAFSQAVAVRGAHQVLYVGGQNAVDGDGSIVGNGDIAAQAAQVASNVRTVLAAAGASADEIVKWNVYIVHGQPVGLAMQAFQSVLGRTTEPAAVSVLFVAGLAHPDFLLEVDAIAVSPAR